jgi:hypothetical protein
VTPLRSLQREDRLEDEESTELGIVDEVPAALVPKWDDDAERESSGVESADVILGSIGKMSEARSSLRIKLTDHNSPPEKSRGQFEGDTFSPKLGHDSSLRMEYRSSLREV